MTTNPATTQCPARTPQCGAGNPANEPRNPALRYAYGCGVCGDSFCRDGVPCGVCGVQAVNR